MDGNQLVAKFVSSLRWEDLPKIVREKVKLCLLDILGATISGSQTPISKIAANYAKSAWAGDDATILMHGVRATTAGAALANGYAANGFDTDDGANYTRGHPGAQIFPVSLAFAERLCKSGKQLLTAMVVGYEVAILAGRCWHNHHQEIWQACGSWGSLANACVAAHLMGLRIPEIVNAIGIAEYHAPNLPMMRDIDNPAMVKHGIGWAAFTGITAAELAARGFTGIPSLLGFERYHDWVSDIGRYFMMPANVWFKEEYAACGFAHPAIYAVRAITKRQRIDPNKIAHVRIEGHHYTIRLGCKIPTTTEEAQFNTAWPVAAYLVDGEVSPRQMRDERLKDPSILAVARKIKLAESKKYTLLANLKLDALPGGKQLARVIVTMVDGTVFDSGEIEAFGEGTAEAWSEDRIALKFRWLVRDLLPEDHIKRLTEMIWEFDKQPDVRGLLSIVDSGKIC